MRRINFVFLGNRAEADWWARNNNARADEVVAITQAHWALQGLSYLPKLVDTGVQLNFDDENVKAGLEELAMLEALYGKDAT